MIAPDPLYLLNSAEIAYQHRSYDSAFELCIATLETYPGHPRALNLLLRSVLRKKKLIDNINLRNIKGNFIKSLAEHNVAVAKYWPLISKTNRLIMSSEIEKNDQFVRYLSNKKSLNKTKPKLLILTCVWQRHDLTNKFYHYYAELKKRLSSRVEIDLISVGSEGRLSKNMCEERGFRYIEHWNTPLTAKWQAGINEIRNDEFDGLIILGSDDFISDSVIFDYLSILKKGVHFYGYRDLHLYNTATRELGYWRGYGSEPGKKSQPLRVGETIGLGRLLSHALLDFLKFDLWKSSEANKGLDGIMRERVEKKTNMLPVILKDALKIKGKGEHLLGLTSSLLADKCLMGLDVKSQYNVTDFSKYKTLRNNDVENQLKVLRASFPQCIDKITNPENL